MIQSAAEKITNYMFEQGIYKESYAIHRYGFEVIISTTINIALIIILGAFFHQIPEAIIYCLSFWLIRKFCGGLHCQTYFRCISVHVSMLLIYLLTSQYYVYIKVFVHVGSVILFLWLSPIKNRKCKPSDYLKYKIISLGILASYIGLSYVTAYGNVLTYVILVVSLLMVVCIRNNET